MTKQEREAWAYRAKAYSLLRRLLSAMVVFTIDIERECEALAAPPKRRKRNK